jgi:GxxExxY protein
VGDNLQYEPIHQQTEEIAAKVVDAAFKVHKQLGPGLLEKVYETCFCYELEKTGLHFRRQVEVPIIYDGKQLDEKLRLDVIIENSIICELKAVDEVNPIYYAQVLSYLRLLDKRLGFLINFNVNKIKDGIKRIIN